MATPTTPTPTAYPLEFASDYRIGIVVSRWNPDVTTPLLNAAEAALQQSGVPAATDATLVEWRLRSLEEEWDDDEWDDELASWNDPDGGTTEPEDDTDLPPDPTDEHPDRSDDPNDEATSPTDEEWDTDPDLDEADDLDDAFEGPMGYGDTPGGYMIAHVPGSFELPLAAQHLLETYRLDAVICLGCVVRGETPHFDYVCEAAMRGIQSVSLATGKPVIFGVLTTETQEQALARAGGSHGNKGTDAAIAALQMIELMEKHW